MTQDQGVLLRVEGITKRYPGVTALDKVEFNLRGGEVHALVGENGAGKSTLIKTLMGIVIPDEGDIFIKEKKTAIKNPQDAAENGISAVFQELSQIPSLSVGENVFLNKEGKRSRYYLDRKAMYARTDEILKKYNIGQLRPTDVLSNLSAAKKQLAEIIKAVAIEPRVLILDEPTSALTEDETEKLFEIIRILKSDGVSEKTNAVYECNRVKGYDGVYPVGYHPTLQLPDKKAGAHFAIGGAKEGHTTPTPFENAAQGGYSLMKNGQRIEDMRRIETIHGDTVDLTWHPLPYGYEEVVLFCSDMEKEFCYSAVTYIEEGFVYYQLKNPKQLSSTMLWLSNGGRHYAPWNGKTRGVFSAEETTSYFHYGVKDSTQPNFISNGGHPTAVRIEKERSYDFEFIYGIAEVPAGFGGVMDIRKTETGLAIEGLAGECVEVALEFWFDE